MATESKELKHLLPLEERWHYTGRFWVDTLVGTLQELGEELGWDKLNQALIKSAAKTSWPGVEAALRHLGLTERDARTWGEWDMFVGHNAFPGVVDEFLEYRPEKVHLRLTGKCILWDGVRDAGLADKIDLPTYCTTAGRAAVKVINPDLEFIPLKRLCNGHDCCECHVILKKGDA